MHERTISRPHLLRRRISPPAPYAEIMLRSPAREIAARGFCMPSCRTYHVKIDRGGGDERAAALADMVRVARPGSRVGIAEPMCLPSPIPAKTAALDARGDLRFQQCFRTVAWNAALFERCGLRVVEASYFPEARR